MSHDFQIRHGACSARFVSDSTVGVRLAEFETAHGRALPLLNTAFIAIDERPVTMTGVLADGFSWCAENGVRGTVNAEIGDGATHVLFRTALESDVDRVVTIELPRIGFEASRETRYLDPGTGGSYRPRTGAFSSVYPGGASFCATFAADPPGPGAAGIGFGFLNSEQRRIEISNGPGPERATMAGLFRRVEVKAGRQTRLPALYLTTATQWDAALVPYRDWCVNVWPSRADSAEWVKDRNWLFHTLLTNERNTPSESEIKDEITAHVERCRSLRTQPVIWIQNWWRSCDRIGGPYGFDHFQGDFDRARPEAAYAIRYARELGARTCVYLNVTAIGEYSDFYRHADELMIKNAYGGNVRNWAFPMMMLCPGAAATKDYWKGVMSYLFGELGIDGVFLDQAGAGHEAPYCHNPAHGHDEPDCYGRGMLELVKEIRSTVKSIRPEALVFGELAHDARTTFVDFWLWHWFFSGLDREIDTFAESLVWMKFLRPDAVFVEQEPTHCSPAVHADRVLGRGIWINAHMPGQSVDTYHTDCWDAYREHHRVFESGIARLDTDDPDVAAVAYGFDPAAFAETGTVVIGLMRPGKMAETEQDRRVTVQGLPFVDGSDLVITRLPGEKAAGSPIARSSRTVAYNPNAGLTVPLTEIAAVYLVQKSE